MSLFRIDTHLLAPPFSINFRLPRWVGQCSVPCRIGFGTVWVNGTVVLEFIGLLSLQGHVRRLPGIPVGSKNFSAFHPVCLGLIGLLQEPRPRVKPPG